jgi:16S rRNA (guanine527-N7)-methyltransferase
MPERIEPLISEVLGRFGVTLAPSQVEAVRLYIRMLLLWNQKVSLTSIREPEEILSRHFGESMFAVENAGIMGGRLADVGSGAGFPGLAIKILCPAVQVTIIEPTAKKVAFLKEVVRTLGLNRVSFVQGRFEQLDRWPGSFDWVCSRALGGQEGIISWANQRLLPTGSFLLWVGSKDTERISLISGWKWDSLLLPQSEKRYLLIGKRLP